jgi:hypothetical protein
MSIESANPGANSTARELVLVCVCSIVGIVLTATAIWFGLETYSNIS